MPSNLGRLRGDAGFRPPAHWNTASLDGTVPWHDPAVRRLELTADEIADLVWVLVDEGSTAWSMGVQGALAEFALVAGEQAAVRRSGPGLSLIHI